MWIGKSEIEKQYLPRFFQTHFSHRLHSIDEIRIPHSTRSKTTTGGPKKRPVVEIIINHNGKSREYLAVIDSGADVTTMSTEVAEVFGIDWTQCVKQNLLGISGKMQDSYIGHFDIAVKKMNETLTLPVMFTNANIPILLGQEGFFDYYRIKFEKDHDIFEIYRSNRK